MSRRVNGELRVEFSESGLTSYAGLELLIRYFRRIELNGLIRRHLGSAGVAGDFGVTAMVRVLLGLVIVGGSRLQHVTYLIGDPLFQRFCGLVHLPNRRTVSRWLQRFSSAWIERLRALNADVVARTVRMLPLRTLTLDHPAAVRRLRFHHSAVSAPPGRADEVHAAPVYAEPGWLVTLQNDRLVALRFDAGGGKVTGKPVVLGDAPILWISVRKPLLYPSELRGRGA